MMQRHKCCLWNARPVKKDIGIWSVSCVSTRSDAQTCLWLPPLVATCLTSASSWQSFNDWVHQLVPRHILMMHISAGTLSVDAFNRFCLCPRYTSVFHPSYSLFCKGSLCLLNDVFLKVSGFILSTDFEWLPSSTTSTLISPQLFIFEHTTAEISPSY